MTGPALRNPDTLTSTHGNNRRPSKADLTPIAPALLAEYTAGVERAVRANRDREARENQLDGGYWWVAS